MGRFLDSFRAGLQGKDFPEGDTFVVAGKAVACQHCGHDRFLEGRAQLHTAGLTFLKLEWMNASAATLTCTNCGRLEWFVGDPLTNEEAGR
jgi:hypothetical protein